MGTRAHNSNHAAPWACNRGARQLPCPSGSRSRTVERAPSTPPTRPPRADPKQLPGAVRCFASGLSPQNVFQLYGVEAADKLAMTAIADFGV